MEKNPISILQERAMALGIELPVYTIIQSGATFKCMVKLQELIATGIGTNKKIAKRNAAEIAINMLDNNKQINIPLNDRNNNSCTKNPIGQLNEICSKHCGKYPAYEDLGLDESNHFVIKCKILDYETEGQGRTKKEAKSKAALLMLTKINKEEILQKLAEPKASNFSSLDESAIELFKQLSISRRVASNNDTDTSDAVTVKETDSDRKILLNLFTEQVENVRGLREELRKLDVSFVISVLQTAPLVLCLKTKATDTLPSHTFIHCGPTYEETELGLLQKTLQCICILK